MKTYKLWNRQETINGVQPAHFLKQPPFLGYNGDIILIYAPNGVTVTNVECKDILANWAKIDKALPLDTFMTKYFAYEEEQAKLVAKA